VAVVELSSGRRVAHLEFQAGVEEIFAMGALPGVRLPAVSGPYPDVDGVPTIWSAPAPGPGSPGPAGEPEARQIGPREAGTTGV
jgi:hypothetical protein